MIFANQNKFQRNLGCFLGLYDGLNRHNEAISIKNATEFINFIHSDSLFHIKQYVEPEYNEFNKGISSAYQNLYKSFDNVLIPEKLSEVFYDFKVKIGNYGFYFLQEFHKLSSEPNKNPELNNNFESIQSIRKEKPYFMGLITSFFIFSKENSFLDDLDLADILSKFRIIRFKVGFYPKFYVGFIEMLLKIHSYYVYYGDNLTDYMERIDKIEKNFIQKARNFRYNYKLFTLNEIFH
ncbi:MAG: hypothetical protein ACTSPA_02930 [Promethearchaeota archaeon]